MIDETTFPPELRGAYGRLHRILEAYGSMMVAYSGGVDSGLLAYVAHDVLRDRMLPVIGISPSLSQREKEAAIRFLDRHEIPYEQINTAEMEDENYRDNSPNRCYFCKAELFEKLGEMSRSLGFPHIAYGANVDDQGDHRPGARAAGERRVIAPLTEAGLSKPMIRDMARALGLSLWDKPASPCLASRIPYFEKVTPEKLLQIEQAEDLLKDLGFDVCRVRHHGQHARIEVPRESHSRLEQGEVWHTVVERFRQFGFEDVTLEPEGFRSGRLNDILNLQGTDADPRGSG